MWSFSLGKRERKKVGCVCPKQSRWNPSRRHTSVNTSFVISGNVCFIFLLCFFAFLIMICQHSITKSSELFFQYPVFFVIKCLYIFPVLKIGLFYRFPELASNHYIMLLLSFMPQYSRNIIYYAKYNTSGDKPSYLATFFKVIYVSCAVTTF